MQWAVLASRIWLGAQWRKFWPQPLTLSATLAEWLPQPLSHSAALARVTGDHSATQPLRVTEWLSGCSSRGWVAEWPGWMTNFLPLVADYLYGKTFRYIRILNPAKSFTTHIVCGMTWRHLNLYWYWRHLVFYSLLAPFRHDVSYLMLFEWTFALQYIAFPTPLHMAVESLPAGLEQYQNTPLC